MLAIAIEHQCPGETQFACAPPTSPQGRAFPSVLRQADDVRAAHFGNLRRIVSRAIIHDDDRRQMLANPRHDRADALRFIEAGNHDGATARPISHGCKNALEPCFFKYWREGNEVLIKHLVVALVIFPVKSPVRKTNKYSMVIFTYIHLYWLVLTCTGAGALRCINRLFLSFEGDLALVPGVGRVFRQDLQDGLPT
jgi:hypothetical protein